MVLQWYERVPLPQESRRSDGRFAAPDALAADPRPVERVPAENARVFSFSELFNARIVMTKSRISPESGPAAPSWLGCVFLRVRGVIRYCFSFCIPDDAFRKSGFFTGPRRIRGALMKRKQLSLIKGAHRFLFRYREGQETEYWRPSFLAAADRKSPFDFLDAAVLSWRQMDGRVRAESLRLRLPSMNSQWSDSLAPDERRRDDGRPRNGNDDHDHRALDD